jgi:hypothetical protein
MEVWRGGVSTHRIKKENASIYFDQGGVFTGDPRPGFSVCFSIKSKGLGYTRVKTWFGQADFKELAKAMMEADSSSAQRAFLSVLLAHSKRKLKKAG